MQYLFAMRKATCERGLAWPGFIAKTAVFAIHWNPKVNLGEGALVAVPRNKRESSLGAGGSALE